VQRYNQKHRISLFFEMFTQLTIAKD